MAETQQDFYIGAMQTLKDGLVGGTHTINGVHLSLLDTLADAGLKSTFNRFITEQVYRLILGSSHLAGMVLEQALRHLPLPGGDQPLTRRQLLIVSSINGAFGDYLAQENRLWALPMQFFCNGRPLPLDTVSSLPNPNKHVVVFVHGLCLHERVWESPDQSSPSFGQRWEAQGKITSLYVRYNTGLHIHHNGRQLAQQLETLLKNYPVPIERLTIVGHSMGGLVSRSACSYAKDHNFTWLSSLQDMACLGSPHQGAPLERIGQWVTATLDRTPITAALSRAGKQRSAGIKDLRYTCLRHEDWEDTHPDAEIPPRVTLVPLLPSVRYLLLASNWKSQTGESLGDGLVPVSSALARELGGTPTGSPRVSRPLLQGFNHMELPRRNEVYDLLDAWLFRDAVSDKALMSAAICA